MESYGSVNIIHMKLLCWFSELLSNSDNLNVERSMDEAAKYHLRFAGYHLSNFITNCKFIDRKKESHFAYNSLIIMKIHLLGV